MPNHIMNQRREFIKKAGVGMAITGTMVNGLISNSVAAPSTGKPKTGLPNGAEHHTFQAEAPFFCPYHSITGGAPRGGAGHFYHGGKFEHNPFTIRASGMSGSPVIIDANGKFYGFMTTFGFEASSFAFDANGTLTITVPKGQELFVDESGYSDMAWKKYNTLMMQRLGIKPLKGHPAFWADVEYCTWVEQKKQATKRQEHFHLLTHDFIKKYLDKVIEYGYPKGKMTLDHGWGTFPDGSIDSGFGSWVPDPKKFPDFRKTMDMIWDKGFTPGLWIGFPKIHKASLIAAKSPNMLGNWDVRGENLPNSDVRYLNPKANIYDYASEVIGKFQEMGVRKLKIDMSYNTKSDMLYIHKELYRAAKDIDPTLEMEFHVPDIFFAPYTDVIRTNDVWLRDEWDWQGRVKTHYEVASKSCPGRGINLDHIGGNDTGVITEDKYLKHLDMYKSKTGYPLVSVLPHHISQKCVDETGDYLWQYEKGPKDIVPKFYNQ